MGFLKMIACEVLKDELLELTRTNNYLEITFLEYALHRYPHMLKERIQSTILGMDGDTVLICYGLCSNGTCGLTGIEKRLVIPRVHDCISLLLGSADRYLQEFRRHPGTIYLSKGWIDYGADPYTSLLKHTEKYGEETAQWILHEEYKNYTRLAFIKTPVGDLKSYLDYSQMVAQKMGLEYLEIEGSLSLLEGLILGDWGQEYLVIPPGKMVIQHHFL